ncbi:MAG: acyltransferase [Bacteroidetes bacterium]|nr:acyltransferase [Bacteroidota bacterium]
MSEPIKKRIYFENLDGMRYLGFFIVFYSHTLLAPLKRPIERSGSELANTLLFAADWSGFMLSLFFVLSGFLITYLILAEIQLTGRLHLGYFYIRRILRIWPLFFAVIFFGFAIYPLANKLMGNSGETCGNLWTYLVFINNFDFMKMNLSGLDCFNPFIFTTWSIAVEEQFYFGWPLLFLVVPRRYYQWIFPITLIIAFGFRHYYHDSKPHLLYHTMCVLGDFAAGGWAAYISMNRPQYLAPFRKLKNHWRGLIYLSMPLIMFGRVWLFPWDVNSAYIHLIFISFFVFMIVDQNYNENNAFKFSNLRKVCWWGRYTYGLYLLAPVAFMLVAKPMMKIEIVRSNMILFLPLMMLLSLVLLKLIAYLSFEYFEKKFLKIKNRFSYIKK